MKIAICLSGQPRTWEKCSPTWFKLVEKIKEKYQVDQVDFFCHAWDFNTSPHAVLAAKGMASEGIVDDYIRVQGVALSDMEKQSMIDTIKPIKYKFESETTSKSKYAETYQAAQFHAPEHGGTTLDWCASQFYGVMYAAHLKKQYEYENNFQYDICFRLRYDLFLNDHQINWFLNPESGDFESPIFNTVYSCHTAKDGSQFPFHRFGDVFWYADSVTFDRICDFYRWLPILGRRSFNNNLVGTEHALYFYVKMLKMHVRPITIDPKVFRQEDYLDKKIAAGLQGALDGHELI